MTYARAVLMLMLVVLIVLTLVVLMLIVLIVLMLVVLMLIVLVLVVLMLVFAASKGSAGVGQRRRVANDRSKGWGFSGATRS